MGMNSGRDLGGLQLGGLRVWWMTWLVASTCLPFALIFESATDSLECIVYQYPPFHLPSCISAFQERERDRVAWLAWDEGFRKGQGSRMMDNSAEAETVAWLNHLVSSIWGGQKASELTMVSGNNGDGDAIDGLSSFVSE